MSHHSVLTTHNSNLSAHAHVQTEYPSTTSTSSSASLSSTSQQPEASASISFTGTNTSLFSNISTVNTSSVPSSLSSSGVSAGGIGGGGGSSSGVGTSSLSSSSNSTHGSSNNLSNPVLPDVSNMNRFSVLSPAIHDKLAVVLVGLPARGKSYIARKLARYLMWLGVEAKVFNVGVYRRETVGAEQKADFFDPNNKEAKKKRKEISLMALQDLIQWFRNGGRVGFYDATNTTRNRRQMICQHLSKEKIQVFFIESICDDPDIIRQNIQQVKLGSPDYKNMQSDAAIEDFVNRIKHYEDAYEPLDELADKNLSYIKMIDVGSKFIVNRTTGYLQSRIVYFLMNTHILPRAIYITRHGESEFNLTGRIGGDSDLSLRGKLYAQALRKFMEAHGPKEYSVWTSTLNRARQTAAVFGRPFVEWRALDELDAGLCDGMTYEEIQEQHPEEFSRRDQDKYNYRYPRGESYRDVVQRLEPVIMELERQKDVVVVGHQAVLRCLLAYFLERTSEELPYVDVPLHTVIKLTPIAYGCKMEMFPIDVPAVNTYRPKPADVTIGRSPDSALETVPKHA